jgi:hypothetical protein
VGLVFWTAAAAARAQDQPQEAADPTTPKGMLVMLARATQAGDSAAIRNLFHYDSPLEQKLVEAIAEHVEARTKIRNAAVKAFGQEVADQIASNTIDEDRIRTAEVKVEGDKATVRIPNDPQILSLVKVDGQWKMSVSPMTKGRSKDEVEQQLEQMKILAGIVRETAGELEQGKYTTPQQLDDAIRGKRARAMAPKPSPTTQQ